MYINIYTIILQVARLSPPPTLGPQQKVLHGVCVSRQNVCGWGRRGDSFQLVVVTNDAEFSVPFAFRVGTLSDCRRANEKEGVVVRVYISI